MEYIIQQLVFNFTEKLLEEAEKFMADGIGKTTERMLTLSKEHAAAVSSAILEHMDGTLRAEKAQRKEDGLVIHERDVSRSQMTAIGQVNYRRTYFKDKGTGDTIYLLDHIAGVRSYERVCAHLSAKLVQEAGYMSYSRSSRNVADNAVSRQTVRNKVMRTDELAYVPEQAPVTPEELHIFADEDHVSMQNGKSQNVNLITISEGSRKVCNGRNELIGAVHVQGYRIKPEEHWQYVSALCEERYGMSKVRHVYIHGDGAPWIKEGTEYFANAVHVLDKYHLNKYMKKLTCGAICEECGGELWNAIKEDDRRKFGAIVDWIISKMEQMNVEGVLTKKAASVRKAGAYIQSNWEAIQNRQEKGMQGSCSEPLISHVLSERLSRNPMGWSEDGLAQITMVRVYAKNGGNVEDKDIMSTPRLKEKKAPIAIGKYREIVERQGKEFLSKKWDWSIFEKPSYTMGLVTGTKRAYDSLSKMKTVI
jgi:hypothetical protein